MGESIIFSDLEEAKKSGLPITKMIIHSGEVLDSIQACYMPNFECLPQHGGNGGKKDEFKLEAGDRIIEVSGYWGNWFGRDTILQITITTKDKKTYGPYGNMNNATTKTPFSFKGDEIYAFFGSTITVPMAGGNESDIINTLGVGIIKKPYYTQEGPVPGVIYTIDITRFPTYKFSSELVLITTLQGLVAKNSDLQIYVYTTKDCYYIPTDKDQEADLTTGLKFWLNRINKSDDGPKIPIKIENEFGDVWEAVRFFKDRIGIKGYIIYKPGNISQCLVTTVAGIKNAIPVTAENIKQAEKLGITKMLADISKINLDLFYKNKQYVSKVCNDMAFELGYNVSNGPRDYAAMNNAVVYFSGDEKKPRETVLNTLTKPSPILGWISGGGSEEKFVGNVSENGHYVIPCDWGQNLSLLSSTGTAPQPAPDPMIKIDYDKSKKYVTFLISDGDNLQMWLNSANDRRWWGNDYRISKNVPVGWTIAPSMYSITPDVWNYYMKSAINNGIGNDEFVVGPSGMGFTFGKIAENEVAFKRYLGYLNDFMDKSKGNISTVSIFGQNDWENKEYLSGYMNQPNISGGFYFNFWPPDSYEGNLIKNFSGKPIMHANVFLGDTKVSEAVDKINNNKFSAVYVVKNLDGPGYVGQYIMEDVEKVVSKLNPDVVVVSPSQMIKILTQAKPW
jgi:hypothetical protein